MNIPKIDDLQLAVINTIKEKSGKRISTEEFKQMDSTKIGKLLGIKTMRVTIIKRLFCIVVGLSRIQRNKALTTTLLKK